MATNNTAPTIPSLTPAQLNAADPAQWKQFVKQALVDTRTAIPAFLADDFVVGTQTVTVQIAIQERVRMPNGAQWWDVPPIINVPVVLPRGGGYSITLPLKKGDEGLLVFCYACFDNWWINGQDNAPTAANRLATAQQTGTTATPSGSQVQFEVRRHHVHDCGFIPGMWSQPRLLSDYSTDSLQIRSDDGQTVIDVSEGGVNLTANRGATGVQITSGGVAVTGPVVTAANGGTAQTLVTDAFYQYWVAEILPILRSETYVQYVGPDPPTNSETTILKGQ